MQNNKLTFDGNAYRIELSSGVVYEGSTTNLIAHFSVNTITICDRSTKLHIPILSSRANILEINGEIKTFEQAQVAIEDALYSAGGSGSSTWGSITGTLSSQTDLKSALDAKQDKLTAGSGIFISSDGKTISATGGGGGDAVWGTITGTLSDQNDLKNALDTKADSGDIPNKVSDLTNDSKFQTDTEVSAAITTALDALHVDDFDRSWISGITQANGKITSIMHGAPETLGAFSGSFSDSSLLVAGDGVSPYKPKKITGSALWTWILGKLPAVPTKTSDLTNDSGFLTEHQSLADYAKKTDLPTVPTKVSELTNDANYATTADVPTKVSQLTNDKGYITAAEVPAVSVPTKVSAFENDANYLTEHQSLADYTKKTYVDTEVAKKQDTLIAGSGINITGNVISATGGSSKSVNVLFVGNSFSKNSVAYLPYILNNIAPELEYRIAIASISGAPLAQHYASLFNQSVSVGGTTYTPTSYNYWEVDNTVTRWTGGEPTDAHQTWQDAAVTKSISDILADGHWDIICFQQGGQTAASDWNTYYAPFIYGIHSKVSEIATTNGYTTKFAWNLTHGAYQSTHANQKTAWQGTATNSKYVMERTGTSLLFPYGTAVQNLRTTSLDTAGVGGDGVGLLAGDTTHLHEGIAKYAASMAIALPLLQDLGIIANPVSDDFRITKALTETYNVPYPNYGTSNTVKGIDDSKCFIAQMAAIASVNNPYSETDLSAYEGNVPETYTIKNYLDSGGSYIDLGVKVLDEKWDVESKFRLLNTTTQVWLYWYRGNSGQYEQCSQILYTSGDGAPRWPICSRSSAVNGTRPQVTSMNASTDYTVSTSGTFAYLNGTLLQNTMVEIEMYRPDHNFELFSKIHTNADGSSTAREVSPSMRVYYFKLKHSGGTDALDLVPAVRNSDYAIGMLDQSTNTFYPCVGGTPSVG